MSVSIRELTASEEWREGYPNVRQIRPHLTEARYLD